MNDDTNQRAVGPLQAVALGPSEAVALTWVERHAAHTTVGRGTGGSTRDAGRPVWTVGAIDPRARTHQPRRILLPLLISLAGELLGPSLEGDAQSAQWYIVDESDIDVERLVAAIAGLLILTPFEA